MCIVQYSKVISSAAKGLLQRADEKCADPLGTKKGKWELTLGSGKPLSPHRSLGSCQTLNTYPIPLSPC